MNQRGNIALYVGLIVVGVVLVLGLGVGVRYYTSKQEKPTLENKQTQSSQQLKSEETKPVAVDETSNNLKTYRNDEFGFEFSYPPEFGDVVVENGNTTSAEVPPCEGPMMKTYGSKEYLGVYNVSIKFPKAPAIFGIKFLDLNTPNLPREICDNMGDSVTLSAIQSVPQGIETIVTNKAGIKFVFNPSLSSSIGTDLSGPEYKTRYNNKLVWLSSGYAPYYGTPEAIELREYSCDNTAKYGKDPLYGECGIIRWTKDGKTSEKIRNAFNTLNQIVGSFKFTSK